MKQKLSSVPSVSKTVQNV
uniref:Uncharacterized protein n=1 Tax=Anguilla anguilla TaxID=7936 RepID=A0A0E9T225_ANGAN